MKCSKCGFENNQKTSFCLNCGQRLDGKVLCPKCNKYISPDVDECPHCGKKIPHQVDASIKDGEGSTRVRFSKLISILSLVASIIILAMVGYYFFVTIVAGGLLTQTINPFFYLTVGVWIDLPSIIACANQRELALVLVNYILSSFFIWTSFAAIITFSIKCIKKSKVALKKRIKANVGIELGVIVTTLFFLYVVVSNSVVFMVDDGVISAHTMSTFSYLIFPVLTIFVFPIMLFELLSYALSGNRNEFKPYLDKLFMFIAYVVIGFTLFFSGLTVEIATTITTNYAYFTSLFANFILALTRGSKEVDTALLVICVLISIFLVFILISFLYYIFNYIAHANGPRGNSRSYRIPMYASSLVYASSMLLALIVTLVSPYSLYGGYGFYVLLGHIVVAFGLTVASFVLYKSNIKKAKLLQETTKR